MSVGTFSVSSATDHFITTSRCAQAEHFPWHRLQGWVRQLKYLLIYLIGYINKLFCKIKLIRVLGAFNKSIFFRLDRICEDCYSLFREVELHTLCKWVSCSTRSIFSVFSSRNLSIQRKILINIIHINISFGSFWIHTYHSILARKPWGIWDFNFSSPNLTEGSRKEYLIKLFAFIHTWNLQIICVWNDYRLLKKNLNFSCEDFRSNSRIT